MFWPGNCSGCAASQTRRATNHMKYIDLFLMLGGFAAAAAVSLVCALGLLVWLAGCDPGGSRK